MLLICLLRCSPLAKHFPHPLTSQRYMRAPSAVSLWPRPTLVPPRVGTLRPLDFFVRFGTGTGIGRVLAFFRIFPTCPTDEAGDMSEADMRGDLGEPLTAEGETLAP